MGLLGIIWDYVWIMYGIMWDYVWIMYGIMYGIIDAGWWLTYTSENHGVKVSWDDDIRNFLWKV